MVECDIQGIKFNAADGEPSDFGYFSPGNQHSSLGDNGMVSEMKAFIRVQDERNLRRLVDVGALFGVFSLVFTRYKDASAWAIEPSLPAFEGLVENVKLNPNRDIRPRPYFCAATNETVRCGHDWKHVVAHAFLDRNAEIVQGVPLDDVQGTACDCMKIDVEGFECSVLRGARKTIETNKPIIFLEAHLQSLTPKGETPEGLYALVTSFGYKICLLDDSPLPSFDGYSHVRVICYPI